MKNQQTHAMLLAVVGGYILYIAYHLYENLQSGVGDMSGAAAIAAIAFFALAGIGVLIYAWRTYTKKDNSSPDNNNKEDN